MHDRLRVVRLHSQGLSNYAIARTMHKAHAYVDRWVVRFQIDGTVENKLHVRTKKILTDPMIRRVARRMQGQHYQSVRKTGVELRAAGIKISNTSVWNAAKQAGLQAYVRKRKPLMTPSFKRRRLQFARKYKNRDWSRHMFADEKAFYLFSLPNRKNDIVWASSGDNIEPVSTVKRAAKINAYAAISLEGKTSIHLFKENMTAAMYCDILRDTLLPATNRLYGNRRWTYVHDNDPKHTARLTQEYVANNVRNMVLVDDWPPNSPDLNPIENLWATLGERITKQNPTSLATMKKLIKKEWKNIATPEIRKKLIDSIPFRLKEVIRIKGAATGY